MLPSINALKYDDDEPLSDQQFAKLGGHGQFSDSEIEDSIKLSLRMKRKIVQSSSFNAQTFPMLVSLAVDNLKSQNKAPLDLVCVLDHSGSMNGDKMKLVKNTFTVLLKYLGDLDRISIVIFDDKASRLVPLIRTTELNKKKIMSAIRSVNGDGGTDINLGMMHAFQVLQQRRYINPITSLFLLSDGLDAGAHQRVKKSLADYHIQDDITINTFGFGSDHDPKLMSDIADLRDGNFYFVEQLDTVDEAFVDCLGGLLSAVGQNVTIKIKPEQSEILKGVEIVKAYGDVAMWAREGNTYITKITNLMSGRQKDFVLELKLPVNSKELQDHERNPVVASAEADLIAIDGKKIARKATLNITLLNEIEEFKDEEEDDREVMKNFYRLKGASVMDEARKLADEKKNDNAKKLLESFKEELENSFLKTEQFIKNLIKDIEQAMQNVNPVVYNVVGRHGMYENVRAQYYQKSNLKSANCYQNSMQADMLTSVRFMKKK